LLVVSAVLLAVFFVLESRSDAPLVPLRIFRIRTVAGANVVGLILGAVVFANFFVLTLYVQQVLGYSALRAGLTFLATAGTAVLSAGFAQALATRVGVKPVMAIGLGLMSVALLWYTQIESAGSFGRELLPGYVAFGIGLPFAFVPVTIAALAGIAESEAGLASGVINTSQQVGGALGVAVASTVFTSRFDSLVKTGTPVPQALTDGFTLAFWVLFAFAVAGLLATLTLIRREEIPTETAPVGAGL
jgi:Na+/melibiose symporter-like transporter